MEYLLLIHDEEAKWAAMGDDEQDRLLREYRAFSQEVRDKGVYVGGNRLQPTSTATTVRVRDDEQLVTDGPFAETKEQLGGYYLIDVETLDEAIAWAAKIPSARIGSIEVRPVFPTAVEATT